LKELGFDESEIAICMSEDKVSELKTEYAGLEEKCALTKETIQETQSLNEKCRILLTTSSLKEGVNIKDTNLKIAFCESHILSEIQQFAGRIREGLDVLYVIFDAKQHAVTDDMLHKNYMEWHYAHKMGKPSANNYLSNEIEKEASTLYFEKEFYDRGALDIAHLYEGEYSLSTLGGSVLPMYIKMIEDSNQYLKFNHLLGRFEVFTNRYAEQWRVNKILCGDKGFKWIRDIEEFATCKGIEYIPQQATEIISEEEIIKYCQEHEGTIW